MRTLLIAATVLAVLAPSAHAGVRLDRLGTFRQPTYVTSPPGDARTLAVVQRYGLGQDARGRLYAVSLAGPVYRLVDS